MLIPFLDPAKEPSYRALCEGAFNSAVHLLRDEAGGYHPLASDDRRREFIATVHAGFATAQTAVLEELLALGRQRNERKKQHEWAYRKVADGIAWQLIGHQLYIARRLYREQKPPDLGQSNVESLRRAVAHVQSLTYDNFVLTSDITSFVQVGDLLIRDTGGGFSIAEVKEGSQNEKILDFLNSSRTSEGDSAFQLFYEQEGKKTFEQLGRVLRQGARMEHVGQMVNTDETIDPDSGLTIKVNKDPFEVDSYDDRLGDLLSACEAKGWAIDVIDDCLFLGAYSKEVIRASPLVFEAWLTSCGMRKGNPMSNLLESMLHPLALPLFNRALSMDHIFDLLFGRKTVFLAVHLDAYVKKAVDAGVPMRWSSRKEAARFKRSLGFLRLDNRVLMAGEGDKAVAIGDGMLFRMLFHGMSPHSSIEAHRLSSGGG